MVAKKAQVIWPNIVEIVGYWKGLPKGKQPGGGKAGDNKSYDRLCFQQNDPLVPVKLHLFEEVSKQLNLFLVCFQTDAPRVSFLVDFLENIIRKLCAKFILTDVLRKAKSTTDLLKFDFTYKDNQKQDFDFGLSINHDLSVFKGKGKINDSKINSFKMEATTFLATLCNHIIKKPFEFLFCTFCVMFESSKYG